jgi:hypothetical protein
MNKLKLTGLFTFLLATTLVIVSCEQDNGEVQRYHYLNRTLTASQVVTPTTATSSGTLTGTYDRETHTLTYRVALSGFLGTTAATGAPTAIHIHAFADSGYNALPSTEFSNTIVQNTTSGWVLTDSVNNATPPPAKTYMYVFNGTLFVDNYVVRESDLLAGKYYIDVHTTNPAFPPTGQRGAIRGQFKFTNQKP